MHWNTLKIVTVVALLASPSAFAAVPGPGTIGGDNTVETSRQLQLADHDGSSRRWHQGRPGEARGDRDDNRRYDRSPRRPDFRGRPPRRFDGHPPRHYRGRPPRHYRGWPMRRLFRHWRRHH